jgi:hypothetical protein
LIEEVLDAVPDFGPMRSLEAITAADAWARDEAAHRTRRSAVR